MQRLPGNSYGPRHKLDVQHLKGICDSNGSKEQRAKEPSGSKAHQDSSSSNGGKDTASELKDEVPEIIQGEYLTALIAF
ncbi:hypothetical protein PtB15_16B264 [Puccinia triticina]|nr:hypothetical protein PtB15_16B264 [Puccinia triticina]